MGGAGFRKDGARGLGRVLPSQLATQGEDVAICGLPGKQSEACLDGLLFLVLNGPARMAASIKLSSMSMFVRMMCTRCRNEAHRSALRTSVHPPHIRKTPNLGSGIGAFGVADSASASVFRVSRGSSTEAGYEA